MSKVKALFDFWHFLDLINFKGGVKNFDPVHKSVAEFLSAPQSPSSKVDFDPLTRRKRFLMMHRSGFKSTLVVGYVLWRIYRNPNIRILLNSAEKKLSIAFLREIIQYLIDDTLQDMLWNDRPHIEGPLIPVLSAGKKAANKSDRDMYASIIAQKTIWHAEAIQVIRPLTLKEPTVAITSARTSDTGFHYDVIINDDLVTYLNSDSPDKARKIYQQAADLTSVLDPMALMEIGEVNGNVFKEWVGREIITTGTPYFHWDFNVHLANSNDLGYVKFIRNIYANGIDASEGYTCPSRFNDSYVAELRNELIHSRGVKAWSAQYLLKVVAAEHQTLQFDSIKKIGLSFIHPQGMGVVNVVVGADIRPIRCIAALDPAATVHKHSNHSAFVIGGLDNHNNLYIVGGFKDKLTPSNLAERCLRLLSHYGIFKLVIESGVSLASSMIETFKLVFSGRYSCMFIPFVPKGDKNEGICWALEPYLGRDSVASIFICENLWNAAVEEVQLFDPDASENQDDLLDAIKILIANLKKSNRRVSSVQQQPIKVNTKYGGFV